MQFVQNLLLVAASLLLLCIALYSFTHRKTPGALAFSILITATLIWTLGSFFELIATTLQGKIFWRNIQQIGVFALPISTVYFSIVYTRSIQYMKFAYAATVPSVLSVLLIFTNGLHHFMRLGYTLEKTAAFGESLVVHLTTFGSILVAYNFILPFAAVAILLNFARKIAPGFRKQIYLIVFCILLTFIAALVKTAILEENGIYIQIAVLNTPSFLIMFYCIFKHRTFSLSPIARDKVFEVINQGIVVIDEDSAIIEANSYAINILEEYLCIKKPLGSRLDQVNTQYPELNRLIAAEKEDRIEINAENESEGVCISLNYYPLYHSKNKFIGSVLIINNITVQKLFERSLEEKAERDFLTNLLNKFGFQKALQQNILLADGNSWQYSILMIDIDNFKKINDTFGHAAGDIILRHFTGILKQNIRSEDIASRFGGDEFTVVFPNVLREKAFQIAERIRNTVAAKEVRLNSDQKILYSISIGIADSSDENLDFDEILERADQALYKAKNKSRNCTVVSSAT